MSADSIDMTAVAPMAFVCIGALAVLLGEVMLYRREAFLGRPVTDVWVGTVLALVSAFFLGLAVYAAGSAHVMGGDSVFNLEHPMLRLDRFSAFGIGLVAVASFLVCWLSITYLAEVRINHGEYYALVLLSTAGMMLLVAATDLMALFLGLELMSIPLYALVGFDRGRLKSNESALKYFLVGSFASAIVLYGMALVYGVSGSLGFAGIRAGFPQDNPLGLVGLAFIIVGFAFKVSSVPFHQWAPDVYEGAPTSVTAFMAATVKVAAFVALLRLLAEAFGPLGDRLHGLFAVLAVLTMVVGNLMAVIQDNLKRLLAYSSIAQAGYVLIGFASGTLDATTAVLFYLLVYVFMNLGAFTVLVALAYRGRDCERVDDLAGLARTRPGLAALLTLFALSLAGIPPTAGFMGKLLIFRAAIDAGDVALAVVGVLASVVSVYYYLRLPVVMYMREPTTPALRTETSTGEVLVLAVCAILVVLLGIFPSAGPEPLHLLGALDWARDSAALLF